MPHTPGPWKMHEGAIHNKSLNGDMCNIEPMNAHRQVELFSVCGIHPVYGNLAYSAYQCFASESSAQEWARQQGPFWPYRDIVSHKVDAVRLTPLARLGDLVWGSTIGGEIWFGWLREWDNGTAIVRIDMRDKAR